MPGLELSVALVLLILVVAFAGWIKILPEYERGVVFRLGAVLPEPLGPGLVLVFAPLDRMVRVSLRPFTHSVTVEKATTKDGGRVSVRAEIFLQILEPVKTVVEVANYRTATLEAAETALRDLIRSVERHELVGAPPNRLNAELGLLLDGRVRPWGLQVTRAEIQPATGRA